MKEKNNNNIFTIIRNESVLFFRSLYTGIITLVKYGPYSIIYILSTIAIFIDDKLKMIVETIRYFCKKLVATIIKSIENSKLVKNHRKKIESKLRVLTLDNVSSKKNKKKVIYEYLARFPGKGLEKGYFSDYSEKDVFLYLSKKGYTIYKIKTSKWVKFLGDSVSYLDDIVEEDDMLKWLAHLTIALRKGTTTQDAFMTIAKNNKKKKYKALLENIINELIKKEPLSTALYRQGNSFPEDLIKLIKNAEYNNEVPEVLNNYLEDKYREREKNNLSEPSNSSVLIFLLIIGFAIYKIIEYLLTKNGINNHMNIDTSSFNQLILNVVEFLKEHYYIVIIIVVLILILV